jgi:hypothetical protein
MGTLGGEMEVYSDRLVFRGTGILRMGMPTLEVSKSKVSRVYPDGVQEIPRVLAFLPMRKFGVRVVSKPGGVFGDRDEYWLGFDNPPLSHVLGTLRDAGYPIADRP